MTRRFCTIALILVLFIAVGALADEASLTILVPKSTSSIPLLEVAKRDKATDVVPGVAVDVEVFANHAQAVARLLNGDVELLFTGSSVGWSNHLNGGPIVMIGTGIWGVSSLIGVSDHYQDLGDLRGKTLVLPFPGAPMDLQMRYILEQSGIDPDADLHIVYAPFPQAAAQLIGGQVDAAPLPEPLATTLVVGRGLVRYVRLQDAWMDVSGGDPYSPQVSLFGVAGTIAGSDGIISALLEAWREASQYVADTPREAAASHAGALGQPAPIVEKAIENTIFYVPDRAENRTRVLAYIDTVGQEGDPLPGEDFFITP